MSNVRHTLTRTELEFSVEGLAPLPVAHPSERDQFLPDTANAVWWRTGNRLDMWVSGPLLHDGKALKTRRGMSNWSADNIHRAPQEVQDLFAEVWSALLNIANEETHPNE